MSKKWRRSGRFVNHHITNRCRGGKKTPQNLIVFDKERENAWHFLFGNKSFEEVAQLLTRCSKMKGR